MSDFATPHPWTSSVSGDAVLLPRRHLVVIAVLMIVPLPLLSFGAMVVPLPQLFERAAARFVSFAASAPTLAADSGVTRERLAPGRGLTIRTSVSEGRQQTRPAGPTTSRPHTAVRAALDPQTRHVKRAAQRIGTATPPRRYAPVDPSDEAPAGGDSASGGAAKPPTGDPPKRNPPAAGPVAPAPTTPTGGGSGTSGGQHGSGGTQSGTQPGSQGGGSGSGSTQPGGTGTGSGGGTGGATDPGSSGAAPGSDGQGQGSGSQPQDPPRTTPPSGSGRP